jgi:hypothetical protein
MGVIKFNSNASIVHNPVNLDSTSKSGVLSSIEAIQPNGGTQIFSAMQEARKMIDQIKDLYGITKVHIILFTDGEDETLQESNAESYLSRLKIEGEYPFTLDTVGFGPNANTQLLVKMASLCGGTYALCFDASMHYVLMPQWLELFLAEQLHEHILVLKHLEFTSLMDQSQVSTIDFRVTTISLDLNFLLCY